MYLLVYTKNDVPRLWMAAMPRRMLVQSHGTPVARRIRAERQHTKLSKKDQLGWLHLHPRGAVPRDERVARIP